MFKIKEFTDVSGKSFFASWFRNLNIKAASKVTVALSRLEQGNFSNVESVGSGVFEYKVNFGPGYRIYFGKDGKKLLILLVGGTKKKQQKDIEIARGIWKKYKKEMTKK